MVNDGTRYAWSGEATHGVWLIAPGLENTMAIASF